MRRGTPLLLCACCFVAACPLVAETIVITETTTATGTLYAPNGSTSSPVRFTDAALLLTYTGDTSRTVSEAEGSFIETYGGVATTSIAGLGSYTHSYTDLDYSYADVYSGPGVDSGPGQADFGLIGSSLGSPDGTGDFVLGTFGDAFATFDLALASALTQAPHSRVAATTMTRPAFTRAGEKVSCLTASVRRQPFNLP